MSVRSQPIKDGHSTARSSIAWNRLAAGVAWLGGAFTTWLFIAAIAPSLPWFIGAGFALLIQWVLTLAERPLWRWLLRRSGGRMVLLGFAVTFIDGLLNAGGLYPHMRRLAKTDVGTMIAEVLNVQPTMGARGAFLLALAIGLVVAGLAEYLWESGERG
jgi:hypothetical protein